MRQTRFKGSNGVESLEARRLLAVVTAQSTDFAGFSQGLLYTFDSPVSPADVANAMTIWGQNGIAVSHGLFVVTSIGTNQVRVTWPTVGTVGIPGILTGNYEAILEDGVGSPFSSRSVLPFGFLLGDANFDGEVNFPDLVSLSQNYGRSGMTYAQGNLDYRGNVEFDADLIILASNYGRTVAPLPAPNTLTVASTTSNAVTLNFTPPIDPDTGVASTTFEGFHVYRSADGVNFARAGNGIESTVLQTGAASYTWTDPTGLSPDTTYSYVVRPFDQNSREWRLSNEVTATTTAASGLIARATVVGTDKAKATSSRAPQTDRSRHDDEWIAAVLSA